MLYDPKWEAPQVKADPFSLESLIAWLEKMPGAARYDYMCNGHCLLADYFTACGFADVRMFGWNFHHGDSRTAVDFPTSFNDDIAVQGPWTFGAALKRARKVLASR